MKKSFNSFSEATRGLNFMFEEINNHYENNGTNILESDDVLSEKKFVLKLNKKKKTEPAPPTEEPMEEPAAEEGGEEEFDFGGEEDTEGGEEFDFGGEEDTEEGGEEDFDFGGEEGETEEGGEEETDVDEFGGEEDEDLELDDSEDEIKDIQSTTGKLGQQLRDVEDISSDMQKWVAKSVLSALDLENMDSEDKKDIIKTVKKKSEKPAEEESSEEEFGFGGEEEMEESYDNYMGYDDDMDGMNEIDWENGMSEYGVSEYDSHMGEKTMERIDAFLEDMEEVGVLDSSNTYDSYMDDDADLALALDRPNPDLIEGDEDTELGGDEEDKVAKPDDKNVDDKLLLDVDMEFPSYEDVYSDEEMDALYGPNNKKYDRSGTSRARRQADKDISKHYYKPSAPGYESDPVEKWAKHKLPYDMLDEGDYMTEDHLNSEMETYEQEKAYEDVETVVKRYGMGVELRKKDTSEDPEETVVYLDIINDAGDKVLVSRINSVGDIEVGKMKGNKFSGEPVDSVEDFIEIFGEDLTSKERKEKTKTKMSNPKRTRAEIRDAIKKTKMSKERKELDMAEDIEMSPAPQRAPEKQPNEPATKPGRPERKSPSERPSRRPFTPPPTITPGEEPGPKAADDDVEFE